MTNLYTMGRLVVKKKPLAPPAPGYIRVPGGRDQEMALSSSIQSSVSVSAKLASPCTKSVAPHILPLKQRRDGVIGKAKQARITPTDKVREMRTNIGMIAANMLKTDTLSIRTPNC